ncbi:hypothetical protein SERLA73DRAFT_188612, partial [Serpula lacrymans var. lacrymans S7.3]
IPPADKQKKQLKTSSTLSQNLDSKAIIDQILSTPIPLSIGNVIESPRNDETQAR